MDLIPFVFPGVPRVRVMFQMLDAESGEKAAGYDPQGDMSRGNMVFTAGTKEQVLETRRQFMKRTGVERFAECTQVHGDSVIFEPEAAALTEYRRDLAPEERPVPLQEADGMATSERGVGLVIKTADCQPVFIAHESGRYVAALHVGWRGNRMDFPGSAVARFCERYQVRASELYAVRGPSLGPSRAEFVHFDTEWGAEFESWFDRERRTMNLWQLTRAQFEMAGLRSERLLGIDLCTASLPDAFYSYRLSGTQGRQANLIWME